MATTTINPGDSIQTDGHDVAAAGDTVSLTAGNYFSQSCNVTTDNMVFESATGTRADVKVYGGPQVTGFAVSGSFWKASSGISLTQQLGGTFNTGTYPRGRDRVQCVVDNAYYHHVGSTSNLGDTPPLGATGNFFYDYGTDEVVHKSSAAPPVKSNVQLAPTAVEVSSLVVIAGMIPRVCRPVVLSVGS